MFAKIGNRGRILLGLATVAAISSVGSAQSISVSIDKPSLDRWNYPFSGNPGGAKFAPTFGAIEIPGFDDRDGQLFLGYDTGAVVPSGLAPEWYTIESMTVTVYVGADLQFAYDPTADSFRSLLQSSDPLFQADSDVGKPVELFAVGFRNGFNLLNYQETSPFGGAPIVPPAEGARNAFPATFDTTGTVGNDVSRQVRLHFDADALSVAQIPESEGIAPGDLVPIGTTMVFDVNPCASGGQGYLRQCLAAGRIDLMVSSLSPAQGGPDGGTGDPTYPSFYTKENPTAIGLGKYSKLEFVVKIHNPADFDNSGFVDTDDFDAFVHAYEAGEDSADVDGSCFVDTDDYDVFVRAFEAG